MNPAAIQRAVIRAARAMTAAQDADKFATDLRLDRNLYDVLAAVDGASLDPDGARVLRLSLRDFRRAGVDRDDETRQRLRELSERETALGQEFAKNVRDDVHQVRCGGDTPVVGIHVYGADIGTLPRRSYDPHTGAVSWFVSTWATEKGI